MSTVEQVRKFWEENPLWSGESPFEAGSREYFEEHRNVYIRDCFAGSFDERAMPSPGNRSRVLDLGCGPGFWTIELARHGCEHLVAADLTARALELTRKRCEIFGVHASFSQENAERLSFEDATFSHVNCQGVIHHTPDTAACVREIARVLRPGGTASISVYYRNVFLRLWPVLRPAGKVLSAIGAGMRGRGREGIYSVGDADEIVRLYDGAENPIGKAYSVAQLREMVSPYFHIEETFLHFFPARTLPFSIPGGLHRLLDERAGFMLYATLTKR